jgi:predicted dehydrogenase
MQQQGNRKIRWAILGAGKIAHKFATDFKFVENAELISVASRDKGRANSFASQYAIPEIYSYDELYNSSDVDAVYIATPHNFHFEQALKCLENKKAVLCEKPVTINASQFESLTEIARKNNVFLMEAMWTYFIPSVIQAKKWIKEGKIGSVKIVQADFGYKMEFNPHSRLFDPSLAGGALLDLGVYPISFSQYIMEQMPESILATALFSKTNVDETTSILLKYKNAVANLFCSVVSRTMNTGYIFGENGYIVLPDFHKAFSAKLCTPDHEVIESFEDNRKSWGYNYEIQHVTDKLLKGSIESNIASFSISQQVQEIMMEIRKQIALKYPDE